MKTFVVEELTQKYKSLSDKEKYEFLKAIDKMDGSETYTVGNQIDSFMRWYEDMETMEKIKDMNTFDDLLNLLVENTFEEIISEYTEKIGNGKCIWVECFDSQAYDDGSLEDFLHEINSEIIEYNDDFVIISCGNKLYKVPARYCENRFDLELPDEIILDFSFITVM